LLSCVFRFSYLFYSILWFHVSLGLIFSVMMKPDDESDLYPFHSPWRQYEAFVWEKINPRFFYLFFWLVVGNRSCFENTFFFLKNWFWCKFLIWKERWCLLEMEVMIFSPNDRSWINWATFLFGETKPGFWSISPNNIYLYPFFKIKNCSVWFLFYINVTFIFIFRIPWINSELRCLEPDSSSIPTWSELRVHDSTLPHALGRSTNPISPKLSQLTTQTPSASDKGLRLCNENGNTILECNYIFFWKFWACFFILF